MPAWTTPLLWPVWCCASSPSPSSTTRLSAGRRSPSSRATASPRIPPPTTAMSASKSPGQPSGREAPEIGVAPRLLPVAERVVEHPAVAISPRPGQRERRSELVRDALRVEASEDARMRVDRRRELVELVGDLERAGEASGGDVRSRGDVHPPRLDGAVPRELASHQPRVPGP